MWIRDWFLIITNECRERMCCIFIFVICSNIKLNRWDFLWCISKMLISSIIVIPAWSGCWLLRKSHRIKPSITESSLMEFIRIRPPSALPIERIPTVNIFKLFPGYFRVSLSEISDLSFAFACSVNIQQFADLQVSFWWRMPCLLSD